MSQSPQTREDAVRKKLKDDFAFWAKHSCKIRTKKQEIKPLVLNRVQRRFVERIIGQLRSTGRVRLVVLKARQQGLSTVISAFIYWWCSFRRAQKGFIVAHKADSTKALFDMYSRIHKNVPEMIRPSTKYSSRKELSFDMLDTSLMVATAGGDDIARSETISCAHLSEVAFWPKDTAASNLNALEAAIPDAEGTAEFIESTANGMTGPFREKWLGAVAGQNGFEPFFSAWFESDEYRTPAPDTFVRTMEEESLIVQFADQGLTSDDQLYWRRMQIYNHGTDKFKQEFPATPHEAFIASGRPVFNSDQVNATLKDAPEPIYRMAVEGKLVSLNPRGELKVYIELDPAETYTIGADVGIGIRNGDWSVAQVLDSSKQQVATWRGQVHPDFFAETLSALGYYYNTALIAPEKNNHGILTCTRLYKDLAYPNVYVDMVEGKLDDRETLNVGFLTTVASKPLIIDKLRGDLRERQVFLNDKTTLEEMLSFVVTESGKMEAEAGCHDDTVMALAIANHVHEGRFTPIEVTDDYYVRAI